MSPFTYFTDPILRAPTIASMLMCFSAALIGVVVFLRKQSLIGEALSHAAYPGIVLGVIVAGLADMVDSDNMWNTVVIMCGAFLTASLGLLTIFFLEKYVKVSSDAALCFVLSSFFGIGLTVASRVQTLFTDLYRQAQSYLYGQVATMTDLHVAVYALLALIVFFTVLAFYKELQLITFNREQAKALGIHVRFIDSVVFLLTIVAVVIGIRSVGVVLMSAMLIAPAAAARQFTNKLSHLFFLAACFGMLSGFLGVYFSNEISGYLHDVYHARLALPTGPAIVLFAALLCILSLLFAPERGLLWRWSRMASFRFHCISENLLKAMWRLGIDDTFTFQQIKSFQSASSLYLRHVLDYLIRKGWVACIGKDQYALTAQGQQRAAHIVRLHRLWEVYLADYLGVKVERVHRNAEEIEHILTPQLERELTQLLHDPKTDPHQQQIPPIQEKRETG